MRTTATDSYWLQCVHRSCEPMVRSCVVTLDKRAYALLSPGAMAYFHLDVPHGIGRGQSYATQGSNPRLTSRQGPRQVT